MTLVSDNNLKSQTKNTHKIKKLSEQLANHIAAGEVVSRPASIVKEFLENSIDAKSKNIELHITNGGINNITVIDDGIGISKDDLELALEQHATSKIATIEDLAAIRSMGFRGEALASIAAVTKVTLSSKPQEQDVAYCYDSCASSVSPTSHPQGTTISASDIFYNTPARYKFLRSNKTEALHIEEIFKRIALSNFNIAFKFSQGKKSNTKVLTQASTLAEQEERVRLVCGKYMLDAAKRIDVEQNGMRLWGWLNPPDCGNNLSQYQYMFLNGRFIRDRLVSHAIRQGFKNCFQPAISYCLYLELDPRIVDVNVHPTKHEVRFCDSRIIYAFLEQTIKGILEDKDEIVKNSSSDYSYSPLATTMKKITNSRKGLTQSKYQQIIADIQGKSEVAAALELKIHCIIENTLIIATDNYNLMIVDAQAAQKIVILEDLISQINMNGSLESLKLAEAKILQYGSDASTFIALTEFFNHLGFEIDLAGFDVLSLRAIPKIMPQQADVKFLLQKLLQNYKIDKGLTENLNFAQELLASEFAAIKTETIYQDTAISLCQKVLALDPSCYANRQKPLRILPKESMLDLL